MDFQRCTRCIMDNSSDGSITFDENGVCNYCTSAYKEINTTTYFPNEVGEKKLEEMINMLKEEGKEKEYDCIMGISGGLDSSYLAYLGYKWGLRILAVHIDDGYDTEISKKNIEKLCKAANISLKTITPDKAQYDALIKAYMKAGVPNLTIPQDNILFAFLFDEVRKTGVKYFLSGGNFALECILQQDNSFNAMDVKNIKAINKKFGENKIDKLKFISSYKKYIRIKCGSVITLRPLNYIDYNREKAFRELYDFCGFEYYGRKHLENILTAFVQLYWLPKKFGMDKRTSHLSSMIVSGQMTRENAIKEFNEPLYDSEMMDVYISIIKERLKISDEEFDEIMMSDVHTHEEYGYDIFGEKIRRIIKG